MSLFKKVNTGKNELAYDAWGRAKSVQDKSLFHGLWTVNIPLSIWYERVNDVVQTGFTNCSSVDGALVVTSGATLNDKTNLRTYRSMRYEPNRGHLYSTAAIIEAPTAAMRRDFGIFTNENGVFFRVTSSGLQGVVRTTRTVGGTVEQTVALDTTGIDLSKGNIFDVQFQWRGVGNYVFYINNQEVGRHSFLGTLTELSMSNPSLPVAFESENLGANNKMTFGCVDVTSEGGADNGKTYGSIGVSNESGQLSLTGFNTPLLAVRSKATVNGLINTRDTLALLLSAYSDNKSFVRVWVTRDWTAITENTQVWEDFGDGHLEYIEYNPDAVTPMTFDTAKAETVFGCRVPQDGTYSTSALFEGRTEIYLTVGDMFVFTLHRENGGAHNGGLTFEFAEQI